MDVLTPDEAFGIAVASVVVLLLLGLVLFRIACPRRFYVFFGCKGRPAPRLTRRQRLDPTRPEVLTMNPILVLAERTEQLKATYDRSPLRVKRHRKEFTAAPSGLRKDGLL